MLEYLLFITDSFRGVKDVLFKEIWIWQLLLSNLAKWGAATWMHPSVMLSLPDSVESVSTGTAEKNQSPVFQSSK